MSIGNKILLILNTPTHNYKGVRVNIFGLPVFNSYNPRSIQNSMYKLKNKGYISKNHGNLCLTSRGKIYIDLIKHLKEFRSENLKTAQKNLLVLYDIPEEKKKEREWFRRHLKNFHFIMIQRSVWVGPSPLPKEFMEYIESIGLKKFLRIFKLAKGYLLK